MKTPIVGIQNYPAHSQDYSEQVATIGLCEIQGKRNDQQDALSAATSDLSDFIALSVTEQSHVLKKTVATLQLRHGQLEGGGATLCTALAWRHPTTHVLQTWVLNLGDSAAYLVILNHDKQLKKSIRLNPLHNPNPETNTKEYDRVSAYAVPEFHQNAWRIGGGLAVSRSLGDRAYEEFGLIHQPEIYTLSKTMAANDQVYLVVACDGLDKLSAAAIGESIAGNAQANASTASMAIDLVSNAYQSGSTDNISVAVIPIGHQLNSAVVLDGHGQGGELVAQRGAEDFYPLLTTHIQESLLNASRLERQRVSLKESMLCVVSHWLNYSKLNFIETELKLDTLHNDFKTRDNFFLSLFARQETWLIRASDQSYQVSASELTNNYLYYAISDRMTLCTEVLSVIRDMFTQKINTLLQVTLRNEQLIQRIKAHIAEQPRDNSYVFFMSTAHTEAKAALVRHISHLSVNCLLYPIDIVVDNYDTRPVIHNLLSTYEQALLSRNSKRHLLHLRRFKQVIQQLATEAMPYAAEELSRYKKQLQNLDIPLANEAARLAI